MIKLINKGKVHKNMEGIEIKVKGLKEIYNEIKNELGIEINEINIAIQDIEANNNQKARMMLYYNFKKFKSILDDKKKIIEKYKKIYKDLKKVEKDIKGTYMEHIDNLESLEKEIRKNIKKTKSIIQDLDELSANIIVLNRIISNHETSLRINHFNMIREDPVFQIMEKLIRENLKIENERIQLVRLYDRLKYLEKDKNYRLKEQDLMYINSIFKNALEYVKKWEESLNFDELEKIEKKYEEKGKKLEKELEKYYK